MVKKLEKIVADVSEFLYTHHTLMLCLTLCVYFIRSLIGGLLKGGRWDLYQNIAMADRFLNGQGLYYSPIEASSPYFPGVAFLSIFVGKFFKPYRDYILLVIASLIGTVFLFALIKLGERFSGNRTISLIVTFVLISVGFESYRSYMNEFKADSLVLLFGVLIILVINKIEGKEWRVGLKTAVLLLLLGFLMDVTKQQALYVDIALGIYLLFTKKLNIKEKIITLGSLILGGGLDLWVIFNIPGIEIQTIKNLSDMPYWGLKSIIGQMRADFVTNIFFFALLFLFVYLLIKHQIRMDALAWKWLTIAVVFGGGQILGGWKTGGNAGNYEAGMISFFPFAVIGADYLYREYFIESKKKIILGVMNYVVCGMLLGMTAGAVYRTGNVIEKINTDNEVAEYLSHKFGGETIMYYSDQYMQLARSTVKPGMDIYSVPSNMKEYMHTREEYLQNQTYKYLYVRADDFASWDNSSFIYQGERVDAAGMLEKYYMLIEDPDMPESLQGQLFVAK